MGQDTSTTGSPLRVVRGAASRRSSPLHPLRLLLVGILPAIAGCTTLGPDFERPEVDLSASWNQADGTAVRTDRALEREWWKAFGDPILDRLIERASTQNLSLRVAGVRVLEARAVLGSAVGQFFPQTQEASGGVSFNRMSESGPTTPQPGTGAGYDWWQAQLGLGASWELDFWGRFRRGIESADAELLARVASYDDVLVSLTADVAGVYVLIRTLEERLRIARDNVGVQTQSYGIAQARFQGGATSERDVEQALSQLRGTEASIPETEELLVRARNALNILLGSPPGRIDGELVGGSGIPRAPTEVAVGIPGDLLARRPDLRRAEMEAAAECARIGVEKADLYPAFSIVGNFGFLSSDLGNFELGDLTSISSRTGSVGPAFRWNILNYGQITNRVRAQDARFQESIILYQEAVLRAQEEVEDGLVAFVKSKERARLLGEAADAAKKSADLALVQYREGATDYTTVLTAQQNLLSVQDRLAEAQGSIPRGLILAYRALGGGWELRLNRDFVPETTLDAMKERTGWGGLLDLEDPPPQGNEKPDGAPRLPSW